MAKILLVDDSDDLLDMLTILLKMKHHEVVSVNNKNDLDNVLTTLKPDVILLDVMLRKENGRELCKEIKKSGIDAAVILISANPKLIENYSDCDADAAIEKPFNIIDIVDTVNQVLKK